MKNRFCLTIILMSLLALFGCTGMPTQNTSATNEQDSSYSSFNELSVAEFEQKFNDCRAEDVPELKMTEYAPEEFGLSSDDFEQCAVGYLNEKVILQMLRLNNKEVSANAYSMLVDMPSYSKNKKLIGQSLETFSKMFMSDIDEETNQKTVEKIYGYLQQDDTDLAPYIIRIGAFDYGVQFMAGGSAASITIKEALGNELTESKIEKRYITSAQAARKITTGMSYETVCDILGSPGNKSFQSGNSYNYGWGIKGEVSIEISFANDKVIQVVLNGRVQ